MGKKWRGKSVYQITQHLTVAGETARARMLVQQAMDAKIKTEQHHAAEALVKVLQGYFPDAPHEPEASGLKAEDVSFGYWDCSGSPTGSCIYNITQDPMRDDCIFCGDPSERK
jgi:hypothetical protein